jgi:hypothetical protein
VHDVSCGDPHVVVQELGSEIRTIRPRQCVEFRMNLKLFEDGQLAKRFENRAVQFLLEVDLA